MMNLIQAFGKVSLGSTGIVSISSALIVRSSRLLEGLRSFSAVVAAKSIAAITKVWLSLSWESVKLSLPETRYFLEDIFGELNE